MAPLRSRDILPFFMLLMAIIPPPISRTVMWLVSRLGLMSSRKKRLVIVSSCFHFSMADSTGSKVSKIVFHPGVIFPLKRGFAVMMRAAFESTGRYGVTQVFNKAIIKTRKGAFGVALVIAERFGNGLPASISFGIGIGLSFLFLLNYSADSIIFCAW